MIGACAIAETAAPFTDMSGALIQSCRRHIMREKDFAAWLSLTIKRPCVEGRACNPSALCTQTVDWCKYKCAVHQWLL